MRLGDFDDNGQICDYGLPNCTHYQEFGIEKIIMHEGYIITNNHEVNNIALIRLNRSIEFGPKMKPICLPFGIYEIPEPRVGSSLTVTAWLHMEDDSVAKREAGALLWEEELCTVIYPKMDNQICTSNLCIGGYGSPLMYSQFAPQRMVLEGILSTGSNTCRDRRDAVVYTRVRSYREWLRLSIY